jgi:hypothetical protein
MPKLVDRNPDRVAVRGVLMMNQVCTQPTSLTTHVPICRRICRGCRWYPRPPPYIVLAYPQALEGPVSASMSRRAIEVRHVVIESQKTASDVRASLETSIPPIDDEVAVLLSDGITNRLKQRLEAAPELSIFLKRDHGMLAGLYGKVRDAVQYEIGNPLTASRMTRYQLASGLYAPLRVIIYEKADGGSRIEYDLPSSLFGQFGDDRVTEVARGLDVALARALSAAAG